MVIAFSGGGTLGHIYPALSIIKEYKEKYPNTKIIFIATNKDEKYLNNLNMKEIDKIYYINARGISKNPISFVKALYINFKANKLIKEILQKEYVNLSIGMGGYISTLVIYNSLKLKKKTIIHEQNSIMGMGNKLIEKHVNLVLLTYPMKIKNKNQIVVGNPRYNEAKKIATNKYKYSTNILVTSGTLGSKSINDIMVDFLNHQESKKYITTLITGYRYYDDVIKRINPGIHYKVIPFTSEMLNTMSRSGIIISRAGSTSMHEILGVSSIPILIPSPNVTKNHQYHNALQFSKRKLGLLIEEKDLTVETLIDALNYIQNNYYIYRESIKDYQNTLNKIDVVDIINNMVMKNE